MKDGALSSLRPYNFYIYFSTSFFILFFENFVLYNFHALLDLNKYLEELYISVGPRLQFKVDMVIWKYANLLRIGSQYEFGSSYL